MYLLEEFILNFDQNLSNPFNAGHLIIIIMTVNLQKEKGDKACKQLNY